MADTDHLDFSCVFADGTTIAGSYDIAFDALTVSGTQSFPSLVQNLNRNPDGSYSITESAGRAFVFESIVLNFSDLQLDHFASGYKEYGYYNSYNGVETIDSTVDLVSSVVHFMPTYPLARYGGLGTLVIDGSQGIQALTGAYGYPPHFIDTSQAYGTGTVLVDLRDAGNEYVARGSTADATLTNIQGVQLGSDPSVVLGLSAANLFFDDTGDDVFYGGSGDDQFYNEGATDNIRGGIGTNEVVGGTGTSVFYGNGGTDTMLGGKGANFMQAGPTTASTDVFYGDGGQDFVYGGAGTTVLIGGSGIEHLTGGAGFNELVGSTTSAGAFDIFNGGTGTDEFYGGSGTNLMTEGSGASFFQGTSGTDVIYGGSGRSFVYGGAGTDVITTGAGEQYVQAGSGATFFNDTADHIFAGRFDLIDNFAGGQGTNLYLPAGAQGFTSFVAESGGTAVLSTVGSGTAEILAAGADVATVRLHTHFTL